MASLSDILFNGVPVYQGSGCVKISLADYSLVMIVNKVLVQLPVIHTAAKRLIGKGFLKNCVSCVILIFQNSKNT